MANTTDNTNVTNQRPRPDVLASNYTQFTLGTLLSGIALAVFAIVAFYLYHTKGKNILPYGLWAVFVSAAFLLIGILGSIQPTSGRWSDAERGRILVLAALGCVGMATALLGLGLPFAYSEVFGGAIKVWRENIGTVILCGAILFGGMLLMFLGLALARGYASEFANLRRIVYGYNAIVGSALLFCILGLINLLPYIQLAPFKYLSQTYDWTTSRIFSLEPASKSLLASLNEPVKVYVLMPKGEIVTTEVETLLNNCRNETPLLTWQLVSRDFNIEEMRELYKKYQLPDSLGLLITYGSGPNPSHEFIRFSDLLDNQSTSESARFAFKGEGALMNAISLLSQGKAKTSVYFAQGHGEPALETRNFNRVEDTSLGTLKDDLEKRNFQIRPLNFGVDTKTIPDDADVVAIVTPTQPYPENVIKVLRDYMNPEGSRKKGRLMVLLGPARPEKGPGTGSGLESFLASFDVTAGRNRVIAARSRNPLELMAITDPDSNNTLAKAFAPGGQVVPFTLRDVRTVSPLAAGPGGAGRFTVEPLLLALPDLWIWAETNLEASPQALQAEALSNREQLAKKISRSPLTVAVAVSEGKNPPPPMPGHPPLPPSESEPRMLVFGSGSWLSSQALSGRSASDNLDLATSSLRWLRGKMDIGPSTPKNREEFRLPTPTDGGWRLVVLPAGLLLISVVMLGCGVWVVRRR
jgi:hypothetical protein